MSEITFTETDFTATPSADTPDATPSPDLDTQDTAPATTAPGDSSQGPLPFTRHKEILENARAKYEQELGWARDYTWAREYQPEQVQQATALWQWADKDPIGLYRWMEAQIRSNPQYARQLEQVMGQAPPEPAQPPQPNLITADGEQVYSASQAEELVKHYVNALRAELTQQIEPVHNALQLSAREQKAQTVASQKLAEAETWPYFEDHASAIYDVMVKDRRLSLEGAYQRVVLPKIRQLERQSVLHELHTKTGATTQSPGSNGQLAPRQYKDMDWEEVLEHKARELGMK